MTKKYILKNNFGIYIARSSTTGKYETTLDEYRAIVFDSMEEALDAKAELVNDHIPDGNLMFSVWERIIY